MRPSFMSLAGVSAAALIAATAFAGQASAHSTDAAVARHAVSHQAAVPAKGACYSQTGADSGTGILSTKTADPAGYSSIGAFDFAVKRRCVITNVAATGVYAGGSGPSDSFTVKFYKARKGLPGKVIAKRTIRGDFPSPVLSLDIRKVVLTKGKYFASVQGSMDYGVVGGWYWETTNAPLGAIDVWQNYGGAFNNCTTWAGLDQCFGFNSDFIATLS